MAFHPHRGFTLIELSVAVLILALLAIAGYRGLTAVLQAREAVAQETRKWQQLSLFFSGIEQDVAQALHRQVRDRGGNVLPEWLGLATTAGNDEAQLSFTRAGMEDAGDAKLTPQRVGYRLERGTIELLRWPALDQAPNAVPRHYPLLSGVREFKLRYMTADGAWSDHFPLDQGPTAGLPAALEVGLVLSGGEKITRLFALQ